MSYLVKSVWTTRHGLGAQTKEGAAMLFNLPLTPSTWLLKPTVAWKSAFCGASIEALALFDFVYLFEFFYLDAGSDAIRVEVNLQHIAQS